MTATATPISRALISLLCFAALTGCPNTDTDSGGGTAGTSTTSEGGKGGAAPQAGKDGAGRGGHAGGTVTAGRTGGAGKTASAGAGGRAQAEDDAGVVTRCGTRGGAMCGAEEFCNYEPDKECGATDKGGMCEDKPQICPDIFMPVCGCDQHTYANACSAHRAGQSVKHDGACTAAECESAGGHTALSDGASTPMCKADEDSYALGGTDEPGLCCLPRMPSGGSGSGKTCGGFAALKCASGEFCDYETSAGGQGCDGKIADAAGKCQTQPSACTREFKPVCGCDHKTYSTLCTAHSAGMSMLHDGSCTDKDCAAAGGRVVVSNGAAVMCASDEKELTTIINADGSMAIEGMLCCVKK